MQENKGKAPTVRMNPAIFVRALRRNPTLFAVILVLYFSLAVGFLLYDFARKQALASERQNEVLQKELLYLTERQAHAEATRSPNLDIFGRVTFKETSAPADQEKLHAALALNSYAKYALDKGDFRKAKQTLDESLSTYPTQEARFYSGVVDYLNGDNESALGSWRSVLKSPGAPDDIYVYLSIAEYRAGNTDAAKKYADLYSRAR